MVLPYGLSITYFIIMRNYFSYSVPRELEERRRIVGCNDVRVFFQVILPLSKPMLAAVSLFIAVGFWNDYYSYMMYIATKPTLQPFAWVLRRVLTDSAMMSQMRTARSISARSCRRPWRCAWRPSSAPCCPSCACTPSCRSTSPRACSSAPSRSKDVRACHGLTHIFPSTHQKGGVETMTTTLKKALALAMCLTMLVLAVPGFASGEATGPEANAAREMVNIRFSQYANSVDDQEGMANDPIKKAIEQAVNITLEYDTGIEGYDDRLSTELAVGMAPGPLPHLGRGHQDPPVRRGGSGV